VIDRGAKTIGVKTADGAEETYRLADRAAPHEVVGATAVTGNTALRASNLCFAPPFPKST
jgi:hypothetical protein